MGVADEHAVTIHIVLAIGTVNDRIPVEDDGFVVKHGVVNSGEVLRDVEVGGEAPNRAAHAVRAGAFVVEFHSPEVVGVVPQVAHSVAVGQRGGEAAIFRIDDGLRVTSLRVIGGAEDEAPAGGIGRDVPAQSDAAGLDTVCIVSRRRVEGEALNFRARHGVGVDCHLEVSVGRRGNQVVGASLNRHVGDDGAIAVVQRQRSRSSARNVELEGQ